MVKGTKKTERAKMTKLEKYAYCVAFFGLSAIAFSIIISFIGEFFQEAAWIAFILLIISILLTLLFICLAYKEEKRKEKRELERKESLINELNKTEFKEIKLEETDDRFFHAFLNNKIEARIHKDNDDIIDVRFWFKDDIGFEVHKVAPFNRKDLIEAIEDVIDADRN